MKKYFKKMLAVCTAAAALTSLFSSAVLAGGVQAVAVQAAEEDESELIYFEEDENVRGSDWTWVYTDEVLTLTLNTEALQDKADSVQLAWEAWNYEDWISYGGSDEALGAMLEKNVSGQISDGKLTLTLDGAELSENGYTQFDFDIIVSENGETLTTVYFAVEVLSPECAVYLNETEEVLPGLAIACDGLDCYVENKTYPYGEWVRLSITGLTSSDESVLQVEQDDNGTWYVYASADAIGKTATLTYTTSGKEYGIEEAYSTEITVVEYEYTVYFTSKDDYIWTGSTSQISANGWMNIYEDGQINYVEPSSYTLQYESGDESVATVDENGLVTAVSSGYADVSITGTAVFDTGSGQIEVNVSDIFYLYVVDEYYDIDNLSYVASPGETISIADLTIPALLYYSIENPDGVEIPADTLRYVFDADWWYVNSGSGTLTIEEDTITVSANTAPGSEFGVGLYIYTEDGECIFTLFNLSVASDGAGLYGDVNESGAVEASDALLALQYVVGLTTLSDSQQAVADVNGDGSVTAVDALQILQYVVGLISKFEAQ